jgi:general nucleoside transport system ATP-binding protein
VLIACQPTRGLDIAATATVHDLLLAQRQRGCATLLISEDLDVDLALSDRIAIMHAGRIVAMVNRDQAHRETIGLLMAGEPAHGPDSAAEVSA